MYRNRYYIYFIYLFEKKKHVTAWDANDLVRCDRSTNLVPKIQIQSSNRIGKFNASAWLSNLLNIFFDSQFDMVDIG